MERDTINNNIYTYTVNIKPHLQRRMSELSDEASSESDQLGASLSVWLADGGDALIGPEELNVPLDLHTACSIGQYDVVAECIRR